MLATIFIEKREDNGGVLQNSSSNKLQLVVLSRISHLISMISRFRVFLQVQVASQIGQKTFKQNRKLFSISIKYRWFSPGICHQWVHSRVAGCLSLLNALQCQVDLLKFFWEQMLRRESPQGNQWCLSLTVQARTEP